MPRKVRLKNFVFQTYTRNNLLKLHIKETQCSRTGTLGQILVKLG